jgi:hypothetical protein
MRFGDEPAAFHHLWLCRDDYFTAMVTVGLTAVPTWTVTGTELEVVTEEGRVTTICMTPATNPWTAAADTTVALTPPIVTATGSCGAA